MNKVLIIFICAISIYGCGPSQIGAVGTVGVIAGGAAAASSTSSDSEETENHLPQVSIISGPDNGTMADNYTFQWIGTDKDDGVSSYWLSIDNNPYIKTVDTEYIQPKLSAGWHTFELFAVDLSNAMSDIAYWSWEVGVSNSSIIIHIPATVHVTGGTFSMGDTCGGGGTAEKPVHLVTVSDFEIGNYSVTNNQFAEFLSDGNGKYYYPGSYQQIEYFTNGTFISEKGKEEYPAVYITWEAANSYCGWLSLKTGHSYRLPSEAEWEYAARGGMLDKMYPTGDNIFDNQANYRDSAFEYKTGAYPWTTPVGLFENNGYGLYDMAGNTWEWCLDWYDSAYYTDCFDNGTVSDPVGPDNGISRVLRGGSWNSGLYSLRCSYRFYKPPAQTDYTIGFRVVKE